MTGSTDREWQDWARDWQAAESATPASDAIRQYVHHRSRLLRIWRAGEALVAAVFLPFLVHRAVTHTDPLERLAMAMLALITVGAIAFSWWNWRGATRTAGETTTSFVALSTERARRLLRGIAFGWLILAGEVAVFVPWVWHRLYGIGTTPSTLAVVLTWAFLALMTASGASYLVWLRRWARRDIAAFEALEREGLGA